MNSDLAPDVAMVRSYLWHQARPWADPETGCCCRYVFGPDVRTLGNGFKRDPSFLRPSVCLILDSAAVDIVSDVFDVLLPEGATGEFDLIHGALKFACEIEQGNWAGAAFALAVPIAAAGIGWAASRGGSRPLRPPRSSIARVSRPRQGR